MTDRTTINVPKESHEIASEAKKDSETWGDYLERCAETESGGEPMQGVDTQDIEKFINECVRDVESLIESHHNEVLDSDGNGSDTDLKLHISDMKEAVQENTIMVQRMQKTLEELQ